MSYYRLSKAVHFVFWLIVLPVFILVSILPVALPIVYSLEAEVVNNNIAIQSKHLDVKSLSQAKTKVDIVRFESQLDSGTSDYRAIVLDEYFKRNNSPLLGYGQVFVDACNRYNAPYDCSTLPAIAYVETRLCTLDLSAAQRNCWGFGGSGPNRIWYKTYDDAIDMITDRLVNAYGPSYMVDPSSMQKTYCGQHCNSWGPAVQQQRYAINRLAIEMGYPPLIR